MSTQKSNNGANTDTRRRNFATVVYPDSAPENWVQKLQEFLIPAFISPLHDKDANPTGEPKKPHYHVMVMFEGKKTREQAKEIFDSFGGVGLETVNSLRGYARYLCHLDNPEKAQYKIEDVRCLCGSDYTGTIGLAIDKYKAIREMVEWCKEYNVVRFSQLVEYSMEERFDWFRVLCDSTYLVKSYLRDKHFAMVEDTTEI